MSRTAREILEQHIEENGISIPISGSIRAFCRDLAADHEQTANAFRHMYYSMIEEKEQAEEEEEEIAEPPPMSAQGLRRLDRDYFYNDLNDLYMIFLPDLGTVQVEGEAIRSMKRAYSSHVGNGETINEIAQRFGWRRRDFHNLKTAMGWVHDEDPYTDEEHAGRSLDDRLTDFASLQRAEFERAQRKKEWKGIVDEAKEYRALKENTIVPLARFVAENPPRKDRDIIAPLDPSDDPFMAVFSPSDAHLHKFSKDGHGFDQAKRDLLSSTETLIARVEKKGAPNRVVLVLGNDWFHVDTSQGQTTAGTPQDLDGNPGAPMVTQCYEVAAEMIDRLRSLGGSVDVVIVPSNHGEWSDYHLHAGLRFGYRDIDSVQILGDMRPRQYLTYGKNIIGLEHGDGAKATDLPLIMAKECREEWGRALYSYWLTGHRHHLKEIDCGAVVMQAPSIARTDRWHDKRGYVLSERANICYLFDPGRGHTDRMIAIL